MTVKELIEQLEAFDPKQEVFFAHPSHDYWKSELASLVENLDEEAVKFSAYHDQMTTVDLEDQDKHDAEQKLVVVLR
jgi:hypothetical protein